MKITDEMRFAVLSENGKKAGKLGGPARAKSLTKKRRIEIARAAALARWGKTDGKDGTK
jgi:hypothetical protein